MKLRYFLLMMIFSPVLLSAQSNANMSFLSHFSSPIGQRLTSFSYLNYPEYFTDNPALLANMQLPQVSVFSDYAYSLQMPVVNAAFSIPTQLMNLGISANYMTGGNIDKTAFVNGRPKVVGKVSYKNYRLSLYSAKNIGDIIYAGLKTNFIERHIDTNFAQSISFSPAVITTYKKLVYVSVSAPNIISTGFKWSSGLYEKIPFSFNTELYYRLAKYNLTHILEYDYSPNEFKTMVLYEPTLHFAAGASYSTDLHTFNNEGITFIYRDKNYSLTYTFEYSALFIKNSVMLTYFWRPAK